jgi:fimbrial chaperone protein
MRRIRSAVLAAIFASSAIGQLQAQSLRVSPVTVDLPVAERSTIFHVANAGSQPLQLQARVYRWIQKGGQDVLEKTSDVVVSPPVLTVSKGADAVIRLVRVTNTPITGEESYRVLIDELPSREKLQGSGVAVLIRQSIPVFFSGLDRQSAALTWRTRREKNKTLLEASNPGQKRVRLTKFKVTDGAARQFVNVEGLAGYVLGGRSMAWELPEDKVGGGPQSVQIEATTDAGPINVSAVVSKRG